VVAADDARFELPEAGIGVFVTGGVSAQAVAERLAGLDPAVASRFKRVLNQLGLAAFDRALDLETAMQTALESRSAPP
jgi:enoyl-CoA hydratase/carnithine racemase